MKKHTLLLIILLIGARFSATSQTVYEDAVFLKKYIKNARLTPDNYLTPEEQRLKELLKDQSRNDLESLNSKLAVIINLKKDSIYNLLLKYQLIDISDTVSISKINNAIKRKPFFERIIVLGGPRNNFVFDALSSSTSKSGIGNLNVTAFADGLARFLIKRGKEELLISVVSKLRDSTKYPELGALFPKTKMLLDNFEAWEYANVLNTLKEAFEKDLKSLLGNFPNLTNIDTSKLSGKVKERIVMVQKFLATDDGKVFMSAMLIGNGFIAGQKMPDVIHIIAADNYLGGLSKNVANGIKFLDVMSMSIRSSDINRQYISLEEFKELIGDADGRMVYFGLLYQELKKANLNISDAQLEIMLKGDNCITFASELIEESKSINNAFKALAAARKAGEKELDAYYAAIFESGNQFFKITTNIVKISPSLKFSAKVQQAITYSSATLEVAHDIAIKNYSAVIVGTLGILNKFKSTDFKDFMEFFVKYGSFAANVVQAKNAEEAEAAIEAVALPVGSYIVKQKSAWNLAVNAYVGYGFDVKYAQGIYAPLGISSSWGIGRKGGAFTLFASVIDVGSLVSYRLTKGNTDTLKQEVRLESIFSPSAQAFYVFPGLPIAVGAGWKRTPKLFYRKTGFESVEKAKNVFNVAILLDIPIINLNNRPRR